MDIRNAAWFEGFGRYTTRVSRWFEWVGLVAIAAMAITTLVDVIGSKFFLRPLPGSTELTGVIQVIAIAGGLAFSKIDGRHIRVEFLVDWLPRRGKAILDLFSSILGLALFTFAGWMMYQFGNDLMNSGTRTFLLGIPIYPFTFFIAICCIPMCLAIIIDLITSLDRIMR
jgi:TRAP-type C4-dicarboxylate transport system permease small subunit